MPKSWPGPVDPWHFGSSSSLCYWTLPVPHHIIILILHQTYSFDIMSYEVSNYCNLVFWVGHCQHLGCALLCLCWKIVMSCDLFGVLWHMCIVLLYFVDISYSFHKQGAYNCAITKIHRRIWHSKTKTWARYTERSSPVSLVISLVCL